MFVQAQDNLLYENPIIAGDGFYIKIEDMERPEIAIKYSPTSTRESSRELAYKRLRELGIKSRLDVYGDEDLFAFPPHWSPLVKGAKWNFDLKSKIPIPDSYKSKTAYPAVGSNYIAWELQFAMKDILDYLERGIPNFVLIEFVSGQNPLSDEINHRKIKNVIKKEIAKLNGHGQEFLTLTRINNPNINIIEEYQ